MKAKVFATGRLGQDAEVKNFENGNSVIECSLATNLNYLDKEGNQQQKTDWHDVRIFVNKVNDKFVARLIKGSQLSLSGEIAYNEFDDQKGSHQKRMYIDAQPGDITICG